MTDQPDNDTKLRTMRGEGTGWTYWFRVPPVCTAAWSDQDWIAFIGDRWIRRKPNPGDLPTTLESNP